MSSYTYDPAIGPDGYVPGLLDRYTAAISETFPRCTPTGDISALTTAQLFLYAIPFIGGKAIKNITVGSGTTAADTPLNQWFALYSLARAKLAVTADDTTTAWLADTEKTLAFATAYTPPLSGWGYVGIMVKATTPPTLDGITMKNTARSARVPILGGASSAGQTTAALAPATAGAITAAAVIPYIYLS